MDSKLSKVRMSVHVRRVVCGCGHAFPSKRKAQSGKMSQAMKHSRADILHKANVRATETLEQTFKQARDG